MTDMVTKKPKGLGRGLEALLGQKVYLECRVKVAPRWRKNEAQLQRFGFPPTDRNK